MDQTVATDVHPGQAVTVAVDALPGVALEGTVESVQASTADAPDGPSGTTASGDYERPTRVVPVRVTIADPRALPLLPGMSASVRIRAG